MVDEALRRAVREATDVAGAIAASRALERAGRRDEALTALWPHRNDPAVLPEIARFPGWTHPHGDAGWTRSHDGPVPRSLPHVRWAVHIGGAEGLLTSPCGLAVALPLGRTAFHDPDDGRQLAVHSGIGLAWDRERFVVRQPRGGPVRWIDLEGGTLASVATGRSPAAAHDSWLIVAGEHEVGAHAVTPGLAPVLRWRAEPTGYGASIAVAPQLVLVLAEGKLRALGRESGVERFRGEARRAMVDSHGVVTVSPRHRVVARDLAGEHRWTGPPALAWACDERSVLAVSEDGLLVLDRDRGRAPLAVIAAEGVASAFLARDAVIWWRTGREGLNHHGERWAPCLAAATLDGHSLWRLEGEELEEMGTPEQVAPLAGRLYLLTAANRLVCLEA